jgi:hypothetical protein
MLGASTGPEILCHKQMAIFSHIEHISHKYLIKVNFSHKWLYFHTLSIFHTNIQRKSNFHTNGYFHTLSIFYNHFATFHCGRGFFEILDFFMVVIVQVWSFIG